ncbi:MAG TPA: Hpt domain-containing protein, partial [Steroidobacteraceae bacterium]|nr:Hpt domain-containing protein [Steroidobacteraceae bacterium]
MQLISVKHDQVPEEPAHPLTNGFASTGLGEGFDDQAHAQTFDRSGYDRTTELDEADSNAITKVSAALLGYDVHDEFADIDATKVLPSAVLMNHDDRYDQSTGHAAAGDIPAEAAELLLMIRDELHGNLDSMHQSLEQAATSALAGEQPSLEEYRWQVERIASASQSLGLAGLYHVLSRVIEATCLLDSAPANEVIASCEVLDHWPSLALNYLDDIAQPAHAQALCEYLALPEFPMPMNAAATSIVLQELSSPDWSVLQSQMPTRETTATPEMVSLRFADDLNQALLDSLLQELPSQTQELSTAVQQVMAHGDVEAVQLAQRVAHTLKGAANTVGIRGIAEISHSLEDILITVAETGELSTELSSIIQDASDCLEAMTEALLGVGDPPPHALDVLQSMLDWIAHPELRQ